MTTSNNNLVIIVEDKRFYVNRQILVESSQYFRALLSGNFKESQSSELEIVDVAAYWFELLMEYLAQQDADIHPSHAIELLILCDRFQITSMVTRCENSISTNFDAIDKFRLLDVAVMLNRDKFKTKLWMHFYLKLSQDYDDKNTHYSNAESLFLYEHRERIEALSLEAQSFILKCVTHVEFKKARLIQMKNYQDIEKQRLEEENATLACELIRSVKKNKKLEERVIALKEVVKSSKCEKIIIDTILSQNKEVYSGESISLPYKSTIPMVRKAERESVHFKNCTSNLSSEYSDNAWSSAKSEFAELPVSPKKKRRLSTFSKLMKTAVRKRLYRNKYEFTS